MTAYADAVTQRSPTPTRGPGMPRPQVHDRLAVDDDRHRRADLAVVCEVLGERLAHAPQVCIAYAVNRNAGHRPSYAAAVAVTLAASSRPHATARSRSPSASGPPVAWTKKLRVPVTG